MSKFVSDELKRIEFNDGEWVDIRGSISWMQLKEMNNANKDKNDIDSSIATMMFFLKDWNFKEGNKITEINEENLKRLDVKIFRRIDSEIAELLLSTDKKKE